MTCSRLGCVLYELFTGKLAFKGDSALAVLRNLAVHSPTPVCELNPDVPESLSDLVMQLLAKRPDDRPQSIQEVRERLRAIEGGATTEVGGRDRARAAKPPSADTMALRGDGGVARLSGTQRLSQSGSTEVALPTVSRGWLALTAVCLVVLGGLAMWGLVALLRPDIASVPANPPPPVAEQPPPPAKQQQPPAEQQEPATVAAQAAPDANGTPARKAATPEEYPPGFPPPHERPEGASEAWPPHPPPRPGEPMPFPPPGFPPPRPEDDLGAGWSRPVLASAQAGSTT